MIGVVCSGDGVINAFPYLLARSCAKCVHGTCIQRRRSDRHAGERVAAPRVRRDSLLIVHLRHDTKLVRERALFGISPPVRAGAEVRVGEGCDTAVDREALAAVRGAVGGSVEGHSQA